MSANQKQFTITVASLAVIAVVAMFAFAFTTYFVPNQGFAAATVIGVLSTGLSAPIVAVYNRLGHVEQVITDGQHAAAIRNEGVTNKLDAVVRKVETQLDAMPQTPEQLRAFVKEVMTPCVKSAAELALEKYRCAEEARRAERTA